MRFVQYYLYIYIYIYIYISIIYIPGEQGASRRGEPLRAGRALGPVQIQTFKHSNSIKGSNTCQGAVKSRSHGNSSSADSVWHSCLTTVFDLFVCVSPYREISLSKGVYRSIIVDM
jgi:hypothetical protein